MLSDFSVDYEQQGCEDASVIRCYDGSALVYALVCRKALEGLFLAPDSCAQSCDTYVDRNLDGFAKLIQRKYDAGQVERIECYESGLQRRAVKLGAEDIAELAAGSRSHAA